MEPRSDSLELWCDSDFSSNWREETAQDRNTSNSRSGYVTGCQIRSSKMHLETALSTTKV